ncbi:MAG: CoA activase, partial [bacterium]|nr:CoA activase [bacterium]
ALLSRNRVDGPVYLIGGLTRIQSFVNAFAEKLNQEIQLPKNHLTFEALGAAKLAADHINNSSDLSLPENPEDLFKIREKRFTVLKPASDAKKNVTFMDQSRPAPDLDNQPTVLGLDLGSTGAKAVLTSLETGEPLLDVYDTTRGNPVDAARRLVSTILEKVRSDVRAVGLTGSGREAVSTLAWTVFPDPSQICVLNEIVAHATSAIKCDPDNGKELSIIEIGGQDAKYIRVSQGRIIESDMNKACSAGTGSFLEEQAAVYDILDIEQFAEMASKAQRPPDLGQMCTVYIAESGADALKEGFTLGDIFAGFQYAVVHNYLNRV